MLEESNSRVSALLQALNLSGLERVKFAGGVVGKLTLLGVVALITVATIGFRLLDRNLPAVESLIAGLACLFVILMIIGGLIWAILRTTDKHPDLAAIEGMELVTLKLGMGAKGMSAPPDQKPTAKPTVDIQSAIESGS